MENSHIPRFERTTFHHSHGFHRSFGRSFFELLFR